MGEFRTIRRLRAILDVDQTLDRVNATLDRFDGILDRFDQTLDRFVVALEQFEPVVHKVDTVGTDLEGAVGKVDQLAAGIGGLAGPALGIPEQMRRLGRLGRSAEKGPEPSGEESSEA